MEIVLGWLVNVLTFGWKKRREADIELFNRLYSQLKFNSDSCILLRDQDFHNSFSFSYLKPLNNIVEDWEYPDAKFHSWLVERKKKAFLQNLREFLNELELHTAMEANGQISIGLKDNDMRGNSEKKEIIKNLNSLKDQTYKSYVKLFKKFKRELNA
ncbi:hypothetical protein [Marinobacterium sp. BA1]|uniref:hypothetical protein n=1 Tax=Marinobacterium sp. BA1 TaxID=3138931 RepID=UPI0032E73257